jgi:ubiquinone/menaquinone biosynthesis C-methylase UbiE
MKNNDYWEKALTVLPDSYKSWFYEEKKYLENYLTNNARVLEVGCGDGRSIYDILDITSNITGVDYDKNAVKQAKKHFSEYPNVNIFQANAESLPFEKEQFDFVICMTTFANFAEKKLDVLSEMKRVLRIDGKIIISVFSESALEERMKVYSQVGITIDRIHE